MNTVKQIYQQYLDHTGDPIAAASLALTDMLRSGSQPLTVPEVARFLRIKPDKVLSWVRSGRLRGYNVAEKETGRPKYRINRGDLDAFTQQRAVMQPAPKGRPAGSRRLPKIERPHL